MGPTGLSFAKQRQCSAMEDARSSMQRGRRAGDRRIGDIDPDAARGRRRSRARARSARRRGVQGIRRRRRRPGFSFD